MLFLYLSVDVGHLLHLQLTGQHHHVGKLRIEPQRLDVRDIQLCRQVHLHALLPAVCHHGNVAGNDRRYLRLHSGIHYLVHRVDILAVDNGVHRQIRLHTRCITLGGNIAQIVDGKVVGRVRTHVQLLHAKIHRVSACLQCRSQGVATPHGCHDFIILYLIIHFDCKDTIK